MLVGGPLPQPEPRVGEEVGEGPLHSGPPASQAAALGRGAVVQAGDVGEQGVGTPLCETMVFHGD